MAVMLALALAALPLAPRPSPPFPAIITDAATISRVAPGVAYGDYEITTHDGPLSLHVVAVNPREPTIHLGTVLAGGRLVSPGETISSMANRTGAVAGINGDYFDINQTNQPLNILVQGGVLERMPMRRPAIFSDAAGTLGFSEFTIATTVELPDGRIAPLATINDWPPPGAGAVLMTPQYGDLPAAQSVTEIGLQPLGTTVPFTTFRVATISDAGASLPAGYYLVVGANAYSTVGVPPVGSTIAVHADSAPSLQNVRWAIGGGPLLVKDGARYDDPDGPSSGEFATHMPASAVALTRDGMLLFFEIDGRQPELSIGVLQPQLAALMIAFGAQTGMQFDGGGSSTIVTRAAGDADATVRNSPSDGIERRVADGLFAYSDAPYGSASALVAAPQIVRALPRARVALHVATVDASGHPAADAHPLRIRAEPADLGSVVDGAFIAGNRVQVGVLDLQRGALHLDVPVRVTTAVARVQIDPHDIAVRANDSIRLRVSAYDRQGFPIALPARLPWSARGGTIDADGLYRAGERDGTVTVLLGDAASTQRVTVGEHVSALDLGGVATFATAPRNGPGTISKHDPCGPCTTLQYDFSGTERAAYLDASLPLPRRTLGVAVDVYGDGNDETLRLAVNNAINERFMYTLARVTWRGWKHVEFRFPDGLPQPLTFRALYVIDRVGPQVPVRAAGAVSIRNLKTIVAGSAQEAPK